MAVLVGSTGKVNSHHALTTPNKKLLPLWGISLQLYIIECVVKVKPSLAAGLTWLLVSAGVRRRGIG